MFTVKFCTYFDQDGFTSTSISCPHYKIYKRKNGSFAVTTYKDMTDLDGVDRLVMNDKLAKEGRHPEGIAHFHACYVENSAGKTIEHIK